MLNNDFQPMLVNNMMQKSGGGGGESINFEIWGTVAPSAPLVLHL